MADYTDAIIQPLTDGSQDANYRVEQCIFWGMGRAALAALAPKFGAVALCANAAHMVAKIARIYDVDLRQSVIVGLVGGVTSTLATSLLSLLIPSKAVRLPIAVGATYAIGKVAHVWIQDGMPSDIERYKPMILQWLAEGKAMAADIVRDAANTIPFTQGQKDLWAGIDNEVGLAAEALQKHYADTVVPLKDKWDSETKYVVHDTAAEVVSKATGLVQDKVDAAKDKVKNQVEVVQASAELAKNVAELAKVQAKGTVDSVKDKVLSVKDVAQEHVNDIKARF